MWQRSLRQWSNASLKLLPALVLFTLALVGSSAQAADDPPQRIVYADVVSLDQLILYNRFGSFDPYGMIYALARDVTATSHSDGLSAPKAADCQALDGTETGSDAMLQAGKVRLKDCKRPRPLVLRANVGDIIDITFTNLLRDVQPGVSKQFCKIKPVVGVDPILPHQRYNACQLCSPDAVETEQPAQCLPVAGKEDENHAAEPAGTEADWPRTRGLSLTMPGLQPIAIGNALIDKACLGLRAVKPGEHFRCRFRLNNEGTHLFSNPASPAGGEGDGGSLTHGLFGALIVEPKGSQSYRSQVNKAAFDKAWQPNEALGIKHARTDKLDYAKTVPVPNTRKSRLETGGCQPTEAEIGTPVLKIDRECGLPDETIGDLTYRRFEIIHGDLNAVVVPVERDAEAQEGKTARPFREFTVIFHDELKTYYTNAFQELGKFGPLSGVRDGFGINYGASGAGSLIMANRKKIGPAADCPECLYEEFFLESWANGDPALLESFPDDPSNVHHSYLNDRIVFRNFHAGPKETHVFHLHSHQWFAGNDWDRGSYLDSQTIGPQQGMSYWIYQGGLDRYSQGANGRKGYWASLGSGNRNRTPGDAIFHCHLYPHFAQGMWELWRVHDVLEDGSRTLPDGQVKEGLSVWMEPQAERALKRPGTSPVSGPNGKFGEEGTPIPGLVVVPGQPAPLLPTYSDATAAKRGMPGYPFYVAGETGHRSPQAPLDMAVAKPADLPNNNNRKYLDGGLPRHVVTGGERAAGAEVPRNIAEAVAIGDMTAELEKIDLRILPAEGTELEKRAMTFHHDGVGLDLKLVSGADVAPQPTDIGYRSQLIELDGTVKPVSADTSFIVNGAPPKPGAPFADPCGAPDKLAGIALPPGYEGWPSKVWRGIDRFTGGMFTGDPSLQGFRRFEASAVQLNLVVNKAGWHDPQGRINVVTSQSDKWKGSRTGNAEPFFFRAFSGECIEFRHTNELPKDLAKDDFQMKVPTDTIGQHIHLVKFDVTSSDGSGNGFNYEDGTFAPDEIIARICKSDQVELVPGAESMVAKTERQQFCDELAAGKHTEAFREKLSDHRYLFQTTVQRWFADPMMSPTGEPPQPGYAGPYTDRTMRTVFTHDHFGPSNIQQHGFYAALLVEPRSHKACVYGSPQVVKVDQTTGLDEFGRTVIDSDKCIAPEPAAGADLPLADVDKSDTGVGTLATVREIKAAGTAKKNPYHPDYREFALAIADFALLYDGEKSDFSGPYDANKLDLKSANASGLERLAGEALGTNTSKDEEFEVGDEVAARYPSQIPSDYQSGSEVDANEANILWSVRKTNNWAWMRDQGEKIARHAYSLRQQHGRPVYPPPRPEAISQRHHDPYLVNYRNEPVPLRVGSTTADGSAAGDKLASLASVLCNDLAAKARPLNHGDVKYQAKGERGNMANVFRSAEHGDPCTPILEMISGERAIFRLIQGAQEVQHVFTVEGRSFRRNPDQKYANGLRQDAYVNGPKRWKQCMDLARAGQPNQYDDWLNGKYPPTGAYWQDYDKLLHECNNLEGYSSAQEIGISEHFEIAGPFSRANSSAIEFVPSPQMSAAGSPDAALRPRDALYHFGSTDDQWNGAWSLIRVFPSEISKDLTNCLASADASGAALSFEACLQVIASQTSGQVENRLKSIATAIGVTESPGSTRALRANAKMTCPVDSTSTEKFIVAVAARDIQRSGRYGVEGVLYNSKPDGNTLFDPDAIVFIPLNRSQIPVLGGGQITSFELQRGDTSKLIDRTKLLNTIRGLAPSGGFPPLTLRMKAGECLNLGVINALSEVPDGQRRRAGLIDRPGDATMPRIVPLNTDIDPNDESLTRASDIRPSARLAVAVPISVTTASDDMPSPIGANPRGALYPLGSGKEAWSAMTIYGGRVGLKSKFQRCTTAASCQDFDLDKALNNGVDGTKSLIQFGGKPIEFKKCSSSSATNRFNLFGEVVCASGDSVSDLLNLYVQPLKSPAVTAFESEVRARLAEAGLLRVIPYAFGPLPIKSLGDVISHGPHGLVGSLIVEPAGSRIIKGSDTSVDASLELSETPLDYRDPQNPDVPVALAAATVTESSLLWQDGMNIWDRYGRDYVLGDGLLGRPLPDCAICDDSYDRGEKGVSYRSEPFFFRLRHSSLLGNKFGPRELARDGGHCKDEEPGNCIYKPSDLSAQSFPSNFLDGSYWGGIATPRIAAPADSEVWLRIVVAPGRARQRAFVATGAEYQDTFPGFGSGHSTLLAPGKAVSAAMTTPNTTESDFCMLWIDGPRQIFAGGAWGQLCINSTKR